MVDITSLLQAPPSDNVLTILLRPAEETQAWQFLSSCIKVTHENSMPSCLCSQFLQPIPKSAKKLFRYISILLFNSFNSLKHDGLHKY